MKDIKITKVAQTKIVQEIFKNPQIPINVGFIEPPTDKLGIENLKRLILFGVSLFQLTKDLLKIRSFWAIFKLTKHYAKIKEIIEVIKSIGYIFKQAYAEYGDLNYKEKAELLSVFMESIKVITFDSVEPIK